ncbi:SDR family NAD(P)-dependent oxidoreductase [Arthrobacter sp. KNU-44]|uniref:SDR family NAD(P)-dependent oxidoreductase n=1 Tax=Arthrobacter sp. KNU-44 TaxID=3450744 RepID=UPI003F42C1EC
MRYKGKTVVVTGGGSGIGAAMAHAFEGEGAQVAILDRARPQTNASGSTWRLQCDVSDEAQVTQTVEQVLERSGRIDVLMNNAGTLGYNTPVADLTLEDWRRTLSVNLDGVFLMSRAVLPVMVGQGTGVIINTASIASFVAGGGNSAYTASKAGVAGFTRAMAYEYGPLGIRVNAIAPGAIVTPLADHIKEDGKHTNALQQDRMDNVPSRRIGQPREIATVATFLASDDASFVNGAVYPVDGGWLAS